MCSMWILQTVDNKWKLADLGYMDRRSRFSPDPVLQSFRTRAVSQPPRTSGAPEYSLFAFPESPNDAQHRSTQSPVRDRPWGQRLGRSPAAVSRIPQAQGQLRSASFSATAHPLETETWPPGGGHFPSTFEEDDEDSPDAWTDNITGQPRSWANSDSRFRSQIPGTRSRSLVPTHGLSPTNFNSLNDWTDKNLSQSIDQRFLSGYPTNRLNGSRAQSLQGTSSMPAALAQRGLHSEMTNFSPFVRDRLGPRIDPDDLPGGYDHWPSSYMGTMREEEPESGATSRRHSVSVVQPRVRGIGFAPSATAGITLGGGTDDGPSGGTRLMGGSGRSMFSDEELAGDFSLLSVNNNHSGGLHPQTEVHPSSFPYAMNRLNAQAYAPPRNLNNLDTHLPFNRTPSDGRSPIGDGNFPGGTQSGVDQFKTGVAKASQPSNGHSLAPLRSGSRDPSPVRNDGLRDGISPVHPNGNVYRPDLYQLDHGRNASDTIQGVDLDHVPRASRLVLLEFKLNRKEVFFCDAGLDVKQGDRLIVEGDRGKDIGVVVNPDVEKSWVLSQRGAGMSDINSAGNIKAKRAYAIAGPQEAQYVILVSDLIYTRLMPSQGPCKEGRR